MSTAPTSISWERQQAPQNSVQPLTQTAVFPGRQAQVIKAPAERTEEKGMSSFRNVLTISSYGDAFPAICVKSILLGHFTRFPAVVF